MRGLKENELKIFEEQFAEFEKRNQPFRTIKELKEDFEWQVKQAYVSGWLAGKNYLTSQSAAILKSSMEESKSSNTNYNELPKELK